MATEPDESEIEQQVLAQARELDPDVEAVHIDPAYTETAAFCEEYGYSMEQSVNCILAAAKTGEEAYAACLVQATRRLDLNTHSRLLVGARKASFAKPEQTVAVTGQVPGGVTPIGLPEDLPLFIDEPIPDLGRIIIGGGGRSVKLLIDAASLTRLPNATVAPISR